MILLRIGVWKQRRVGQRFKDEKMRKLMSVKRRTFSKGSDNVQ